MFTSLSRTQTKCRRFIVPRHMARSSGFTLIELVVVVVILGIMAATAMPKYMDMRREARIAALKGMEGTLRSAALNTQALFYAFPDRRSSAPLGTTSTGNDTSKMYVAVNDTTQIMVLTYPEYPQGSIGMPVAGPEGILRLIHSSCTSIQGVMNQYTCDGYTATNMGTHLHSATDDAAGRFFPPGVTPEPGHWPKLPLCHVVYQAGFVPNYPPRIEVVSDDC